MNASTTAHRVAGRAQGFTLIGLSVMPTLVIAALVSDLPQLFEHFASVPNHAFLVPMILTVPSLCVALFSGVAGIVADRFGRRRLLLVSLAAFSVLGLMPLLFDSLAAIIACRVVVGLAEASILIGCNALYGDYFAEDERKRWLGWQQTIVPFFNAGLAGAGGLLAAHDWRSPFWLYALGLPVLWMVWRFAWEPAPASRLKSPSQGHADTTPFAWGVAARIGGVTLLSSVLFFMLAIQQGRIFSAVGVQSPATIGLLIMGVSVGAVVGAMVFQRLRHWPFGTLLALSIGAYGLSFAGVSMVQGVPLGFGFSFIGHLGSSVMLPTLIAWTLASFAPEQRGRGMGVWGAVFFAGQFVSAPLLTVLEQQAGGLLTALGWVGAAALVTAVLALFISWRGRSHSAALSPRTPT